MKNKILQKLKFTPVFFLTLLFSGTMIFFSAPPTALGQTSCDSSVVADLNAPQPLPAGETFSLQWGAEFSTYEPTGGRNFYSVKLYRGSIILREYNADTDYGQQPPEGDSFQIRGGIDEPTEYSVEATVISRISCPGGASDSKTITVEVGAPVPECSINAFTADDDTPAYNTGTILRFSLNGSFPWNISLLGGSVNPSPNSGTGSSGAPSTGNLTEPHIYRLSCGSEFQDLTVIPDSDPN